MIIELKLHWGEKKRAGEIIIIMGIDVGFTMCCGWF